MMMKYLLKKKRRGSSKQQKQPNISTTSADSSVSYQEDTMLYVVASPMGTGQVSSHGLVEFFVLPPRDSDSNSNHHSSSEKSRPAAGKQLVKIDDSLIAPAREHYPTIPREQALPGVAPEQLLVVASEKPPAPALFVRRTSSFLRVADLSMDDSQHVSCPVSNIPNFHHMSCDPPPGVDFCPKERWVCLDDGTGGATAKHAPIAPTAVAALANFGMSTLLDETMWTPDSKTAKLIKTAERCWETCTFEKNSPVPGSNGSMSENVLVWSGKFHHDFFGSDLPAVRAAAIIPMSAQALNDLLVDSDRVKEYNAMSQGRTDLLLLQKEPVGGPFGGVTKVMRSESRPPMLRKTLQFTSMFHAQQTNDGNDYLLVSRAVQEGNGGVGQPGVLVSEILMGCNYIRRVSDNSCLMVSVNHIRSPMVPMMIAKRIGLQAAVNFVHDLRRCCHAEDE